MRIFITGATGFIGSHLAGELARRGEQLFCLVRKTSDTTFLKALGARLFYGDLTDETTLDSIPDCEIVFHCAGEVEAGDPGRLRAGNVRATEQVCRLALRRRIRRLVHVSSVAVINGNPCRVFREDLPYAATNNYGLSKIEAEKTVLAFRAAGLACAVIRPPMVYGEGEPHALDLALSLLARRLLPLPDRGEHLLSLAYVKNVVAALLLAAERTEFLQGAFFCADRDVLTVAQIFGQLAASIGARPPVLLPRPLSAVLERLPAVGKRIGALRRDTVYDTARIVAAGYTDSLAAREALARTGQWWLRKRKERRR